MNKIVYTPFIPVQLETPLMSFYTPVAERTAPEVETVAEISIPIQENESNNESTVPVFNPQISYTPRSNPAIPTFNPYLGYSFNTGGTQSSIDTSTTVQRGRTTYKTDDIDVGNLAELLTKFEDAGMSVRVTSGKRPGARTSNGSISHHATGDAIDITPGEGETWDSLKAKLRNNPDLANYMRSNGWGILDETREEMLKRTGGTGAHWHIGKDKIAISGLEEILLGRHGLKTKKPLPRLKPGSKLSRSEQKMMDRVTERIIKEDENAHPVRRELPLQPMTQEIVSWLPGVGDTMEVAEIGQDVANGNLLGAGIGAGLLLLPGVLGSKIKHLFGKHTDNVFILDKGKDREIKNQKSLLAERLRTGGAERTNLPVSIAKRKSGVEIPIADKIQNYEPTIIEVVDGNGKRYRQQIADIEDASGKIRMFDENSTLKEISPEWVDPSIDQVISPENRRAALDHELQHWLDLQLRRTNGTYKDLSKSDISFISDGAEQTVKDPLELAARAGQVKTNAGITDGSKRLTGEELERLFDLYLSDKSNPDNYISLTKRRVTDWDAFADWANTWVPAVAVGSTLILNGIGNETEDIRDSE